MKQIPLTQGKYAIIDDKNFEWLNQWKWCAEKIGNMYYAVRTIKIDGKNIPQLMHRLILGLVRGDGKLTDHRNHNGLDNYIKNLRICNNSQNHHNQLPTLNAKSKYKGVGWFKRGKKWCARIYTNGKHYHIGYFDNEIKAARAYDKKARELFKEYAYTNFSPERK